MVSVVTDKRQRGSLWGVLFVAIAAEPQCSPYKLLVTKHTRSGAEARCHDLSNDRVSLGHLDHL